jgi:hypothetical protein
MLSSGWSEATRLKVRPVVAERRDAGQSALFTKEDVEAVLERSDKIYV